jgi:hypothetical protein
MAIRRESWEYLELIITESLVLQGGEEVKTESSILKGGLGIRAFKRLPVAKISKATQATKIT